jgi:hypothetical protein
MVDTPWMTVEEVADRVGVSRQAITQAARDQLSRVGLARRAGNRWELEPGAVEVRIESGKWPGASADALDTMVELLAAANERAESAALHAALASAGELEARLRERDVELKALRRELTQLRAEYRAHLQARLDALSESS